MTELLAVLRTHLRMYFFVTAFLDDTSATILFYLFSLTQLRQLILAIHADGASPDSALETYTFHFTYKDENLSGCSILRKNNKTNE
jgi:hypothetical protein